MADNTEGHSDWLPVQREGCEYTRRLNVAPQAIYPHVFLVFASIGITNIEKRTRSRLRGQLLSQPVFSRICSERSKLLVEAADPSSLYGTISVHVTRIRLVIADVESLSLPPIVQAPSMIREPWMRSMSANMILLLDAA